MDALPNHINVSNIIGNAFDGRQERLEAVGGSKIFYWTAFDKIILEDTGIKNLTTIYTMGIDCKGLAMFI